MKLLQNLKNNDKKTYVLLYTLLFCLLAPLVFFWFLWDGRSFIWINDGADQHFIALMYYGRTLREWISGIFTGQGIAFPLYDFAIGQGDDIITTLHYYCLGDPLALFFAFCPEQYTEYLYNFLVLLRFYLMGLSFSAFCFYQKKEASHTLLGAFLYAFCGFALIGAIKHPFFLNPLIYLPLLCLSIEKVLRKESSKLFIAMTALCAMSNFYFFYMLTVLAVLYAIVRFFCMYLPEFGWSFTRGKQWKKTREREKRQALAKKIKKGRVIREKKSKEQQEKPEWLRAFVEIVPRGIGAYLTGVCIAAVIFVPVVLRFLNNPRYVEDASKLKLLYSANYYGRMLASFTGKAWTPGYWAFFGFAPIVILALCVLFTKKERQVRSLQIFTVLGFLFLLFPVFGYILNGFDYVSNRWMFAFHFLMAYIVTALLPELLAGMKKYAVYLCGAITVGLFLVNLVAFFNGNRVDVAAYVMLLLVFGFCIFIGPRKKKEVYYAGLFWLTLFSVVYNGSTVLKSKRTQFYPAGMYYEYIANQPASELTQPEEDTFYRVDSYVAKSWDFNFNHENPTREDFLQYFEGTEETVEEGELGDEDADEETEEKREGLEQQEVITPEKKVKKLNNYNLSLLHGYYGLSEYFSMLNPYYPVYVTSMGLASSNYSSQIASLDQRTALNALASVKYYMSSSFEYRRVPYGYEEVERFKAEDGKTMILYENQYALPLAFAYDTWIDEADLKEISPLEKQELMLTTLVLEEGQECSDLPNQLEKNPKGEIIVKEAVWSTDNPETLVKKKKSIKFSEDGMWADFTVEGVENCEVYVYLENVTFSKAFTNVSVCADGVYKWTNLYGTSKKHYFGRKNILFNLGYYEDALNSFSLRSGEKGTLSFEKLTVLFVPMDNYEEKITALQDEVLETIQMSKNRVEGTVTVSEDKLLFFSIPYSKGIHAKVNGETVSVYQANELYLAIPVKAGENTVVLTYRTPGLLVGALLSVGTWSVLLGIFIQRRKKNKV